MADSVEIYALYDESFGTDGAVAVYEQLLGLDGFECSRTPEDLRERLERGSDPVQFGTYHSLHLSPAFDDGPEGLPALPHLRFNIEAAEFDHATLSAAESTERVQTAVEFAARLYDCSRTAGHPPLYLFGASPTHVAKLRAASDFVRTTTAGVQAGEVEELFWLQVFPPRMLDDAFRDRLATTPAVSHRSLDDGAVLLVAHERPTEWASDYLAVAEHLGLGRG